MKQLKHLAVIGILFVVITGALAHFLYGWTDNNNLIGLFVPVNESIWEHMKLLFFPMLLYSLVLMLKYKRNYPCITSAACSGIILGTFLIPVLFYAYTAILGKNVFILDLGTFILSTMLGFWLLYRLALSCRLKPYVYLLCSIICILFICFMIFTYHPPDVKIFENPAP